MSAGRHNLPQLLGGARRWFDEGLLAALEAEGAEPVSVAQLHVFTVLDEPGTTVADLARRMGVARQTAHQAVHGLVAAGLLEQVPDPHSARRRLIRRTAKGRRVHERAEAAIENLERALVSRIGADGVLALREILERPWGQPPRGRHPGT
ncbi:MarR family winged helix-turn-helix transcriptional regulator [Streptomyces sp. NPDC005423]|uniref:MarR family winged helix-turn-helix transcriptional regulator n=1 Tax=Streptomyces sp. NPDC005423 TaxID=3155343 RepID=UPI0033AD47CE